MPVQNNRVSHFWNPAGICSQPETSKSWSIERSLTSTFPISASDSGTLDMDLATQKVGAFLEWADRISKLDIFKDNDMQPGAPSPRPASSSIIVPITTFSPEPYEVLASLQVVVQGVDGDFTATFFDASIGASGETQQGAVDNLKEIILMSFESLVDDDEANLGPMMIRQKAVLEAFIRRRR